MAANLRKLDKMTKRLSVFFLSLAAFFVAFVVMKAAASSIPAAFAQEEKEENDQGKEGDGGPPTLTDAQIANLGIETAEAVIDKVQDSVSMVAKVALLPERQAYVSPIFEGQVRELLVTLGDEVAKDQAVAVVEPLIAGSKDVTLRAPIDGVISAQNVRLGESVNTETILFEIADDRQVLMHGELFESSGLTRIRADQKALIELDIFQDEVFEGDVQRVYIKPHEGKSTFDIFAVLDNERGLLRPGLLGTMTIGVGIPVSAIVIPKRAVLGELGDYFLFVREGNVFERRAVRLGLDMGPRVEILEGVFPSEQVVTQGHYQLQFIGDGAVGLDIDHDHEH